jgi:hypothetical protein
VPLYDGLNIFGRSVECKIVDNPRERQENAFFGLTGVESLDGGDRGRVAVVDGVLYGAYATDFGNALSLLRSYRDGVARPFVDQYGLTWQYALLDRFEPKGRVRYDPNSWGFVQDYQATFRILV